MRRRSAKMAALYKERRVLVARTLADRPVCEARLVVCQRVACDVHEILTRARGGSITDEKNLLCLCRACHVWITDHPKWADMHGFTIPSWVDYDEGLAEAARLRAAFRAEMPFVPYWAS